MNRENEAVAAETEAPTNETKLEAATLFVDRKMDTPEILAIAAGRAAVFSAPAPGRTTPNEDAAIALSLPDGAGVIAVADGLGGNALGHEASALAVAKLREAVEAAATADIKLRTAILNAFESADEAVAALNVGAATTMAVLEIHGDTIRPYHVGDSMIFVIGGGGKIKHQSIPHSPIGYGLESGLLDESEAIHHEERHIVSNVIGSRSMHIEIGARMTLAQRDTVLVTSDGLVDNAHLEEIIDIIRKGELHDSANALAALAAKRMTQPAENDPSKPDDLTFIAYRPH